MNEGLKKVLMIIGFVLATVVIGFVIYYIFFRPLLPPTNENANLSNINGGLPLANGNANIAVIGNTNGTLPTNGNQNANINAGPTNAGVPQPVSEIANGGFTKVNSLTKKPAYFSTLSSDGKTLSYYNPNDGLFYKISADGTARPLSDKVFYDVSNVSWNPDGSIAVIEYPDGSNITYDFGTAKQTTLPQHWEDFNFSPSGNQIITKSMGLDPENNFLVISQLDGTGVKIISELGANADKVIAEWSPNNQMVAMRVGDLDYDRKEIYFIGQNEENFKSVVVEGRGFEGIWSPQGDKILHSVYSDASAGRPSLWIVDANVSTVGQNRRALNLQTWADKCTFYDNATVYCAVPSYLPEQAGMFPNEADNAPDVLYKLNLNSGAKTLIAQPAGNFTMENLIVSDDGYYLYFTDKTTGLLNQIKLK